MTDQLDPAIEYHIVNSMGWPSLRPLQANAIVPIRSGMDAVLVAPTAGGKTEAAVFPLLSEMVKQNWQGLSVLYVTPLRALLNNLHPRIDSYCSWLGRSAGLWHGDTSQPDRNRMLAERPDVLLTTPESLEAMLVSRKVDHHRLFNSVQAIVVDELHVFAGSDRGWHLLAVLERIERVAGRRIQRIGLSATVGNPESVGRWLQGSTQERRAMQVVREEVGSGRKPDIMLDYVGGLENAATVISRLYRGEKRLVFADSRRKVEALAFHLREGGVQTFVSHSSLSSDERRQSERAFAEGRDTVIVATSTLELGIDVGDLDRVIQVGAPSTVSSFLQRLGRTGRRPGTTRNTLFLALDFEDVLNISALMLLWQRGFVEAIDPPPNPRHLAAQQFIGLALQEGTFGRSTWRDWWGDLPLMDDGSEVLNYLEDQEFLVADSDMLMIGPRAEREFGQKNFLELLSTFVTELELQVIAGNREIGYISPLALSVRERGSRPIILAGRAWQVRSVDWDRFVVWVEEVHTIGDVKWRSNMVTKSFELCQAQRDVLLGETPLVPMSQRFPAALAEARDELADTVAHDRNVLQQTADNLRLWTWAGLKANATLLAGLGLPASDLQNEYVQLPDSFDAAALQTLRPEALPIVDQQAINGLKFSVALPAELAARTLGERLADARGAEAISTQPVLRTTTAEPRRP